MSDEIDFDPFDQAADAVPAKPSYSRGNIESLPDGDYDFIITGFEWKSVGVKKVCTIAYATEAKVGDKEQEFKGELTYWVMDQTRAGQEGYDKVGIDLKKTQELKVNLGRLGFDVDSWTHANGRGMGKQLEKLRLAAKGLMFAGKKKTNEARNGKVYVNVYVNGRAKRENGSLADGRPEKLDEEWITSVLANSQESPF